MNKHPGREPSRPDDPQSVLQKQQERAEQDARTDDQPSQDPQLRRVHEAAHSPDEGARGNDTAIQDGGARHRQQ
jgi:hypothetical protein